MFMSLTGSLALIVLVLTLTSNFTLAFAQPSPNTGISNNRSGIVSSSAVPNSNPANILNGRLEKISSLSNILEASMVDGIQVSTINVGDTDLTVTLKRQITTSPPPPTTSNTTVATNNVGNISLPVTVIAAKLPIANLTEIISAIEASRGSVMATGSANPTDTLNGQTGSNGAPQSNVFQILSLLKNIQIGAASIVNANWTLPQTVSMGFLGLGNRIAASAPSDFVLVLVVPFQGESSIPTLGLG
jgi:hypothetical protein